jgi:exodeoxyribonuclease VII small subunit
MASERAGREAGDRGRQNGTHPRPAARRGAGSSPSRDELESLPLEAALEELDRIMTALEDGQLALDDSLALYERGMRLTKRCQEILDTAELRVQRLRPAANPDDGFRGSRGAYALEEFEAEE